MRALHRCGLLLQMSYVQWSVCLSVGSVGWAHGWAVQKRLNRSRCVWMCWPKKSCNRWGRNHANENGQFRGCCPVHWIALGVTAAVYAAKEIIQSSITARLLQPTKMLPAGPCHTTLLLVKICRSKYLSELLQPVADLELKQRLRSSSTSQLVVPCMRRSTIGDRAYTVAAPRRAARIEESASLTAPTRHHWNNSRNFWKLIYLKSHFAQQDSLWL